MSSPNRLLFAAFVTGVTMLLIGWFSRAPLASSWQPGLSQVNPPLRRDVARAIPLGAMTMPSRQYPFFDDVHPVLDQREAPPDASGRIVRTWLIALPPYGPVRIEETWQRDQLLRRDAFIAGEVIVTLRPHVAEASLAQPLTEAGATSWSRIPFSDAWLVRFDRPTLDTWPAARAALRRHPHLIAEVEGNGLGRGGIIPNDGLFGQQFALRNIGQDGGTVAADVRATEAWDIVNSAPGVVVAVLDSGVDFGHRELTDNLYRDDREVLNGSDDDRNGFIDDFRGWDFTNNDNDPTDDHGHGTLVTGIIAAKGNNGNGTTGVVWSTQIMPVKVLDSANRGTTANMLAGINYARAKGAKLMNLSLIDYPYNAGVFNAIGEARAAGILLVISAGNSGTNNDVAPNYPSSYAQPNVVAVANTTRNDVLNVGSSGSNYGAATVHLAAPGTSVLTTSRGNGYAPFTGTSAAAPHVTGALALLIHQRPDASLAQWRQWIFESVDRVPALAGRCSTGGRLNVATALRLAGLPPPPPVPPTIIAQPTSQTLTSGQTAVLSVVATGTPTPTYQWFKDNVAIAGATDATLRFTAQNNAAGTYLVEVTTASVTVRSHPALVTVAARPMAGRLINLAIRSKAGNGAETLIVGVNVGGAGTTGPMPVLIRGMGPTLTRLGLSGVLLDPAVAAYSGAAAIATNDNWAGNAAIEEARLRVGAFAFDSITSRDAALLTSRSAGAYTVQVSGSDGAVGLALAEIYDATPRNEIIEQTPRLINLAARAYVGTDGDVLIAGFTVGGDSSRTIFLRAVGPTLETFAVTGALADPKLDLFRDSTVIATNDNWAGAADLTAAASRVGAFALPPTSKDAALLIRLEPGNYTAHVSGVDRATGVALVEIYEAP